jgi:restriction endonuclease S subunit
MIQQTQNKQLPKRWKESDFSKCFQSIAPTNKIKKSTYLKEGILPVIDQGEDLIGGYINENSKKQKTSLPIIIFGDHTRRFKFINFDFVAGADGIKILKINESIDPKFAFYQCLTLKFPNKGYSRHFQFVNKTKITYPESKEEQTLIVQEIEKQFTRLDASVKSLKSVKKKLEVYRKAVLNKSFYGDKKTFPEIISKEKHSMKRGPFGGSLKKEIFVPSGFLVYEQYHPINNDFDFGRYFITKEKFEEMKAFFVKPGDLLISCSGTIGKIAEIPEENFEEGIINQALLKITLDNSKVLNKYFIYLFQSQYIQKHLTKISRGVAIKNVPSVKELKTIEFPIPSIQEQQTIIQEIESKFSVIDKIEQVVNESLEKSEKLRKSILKSAFEGKLVKMEEVEE